MDLLIVAHVVGRVHHWFTRTFLCALSHVAQHSGELVVKTRQWTTQQILRQASTFCRTVQRCYAFDLQLIYQALRSLFVLRYLTPEARRRVPLLKEYIAGTAADSPRGKHHPKPSSPTQPASRFKWEDLECSHCHVGLRTHLIVQFIMLSIAYI
jgi:hypothetical protein